MYFEANFFPMLIQYDFSRSAVPVPIANQCFSIAHHVTGGYLEWLYPRRMQLDGFLRSQIYVEFPMLFQARLIIIIIIIIIIWFGDTVTVSHSTKCDTNSKVRALS